MVYVITPWQCLLDFNSQNLLVVLKEREKILDRSVVVVMLNNDKQVKLDLFILGFFFFFQIKKKLSPPFFQVVSNVFFFYFSVNNDGMKRIRVKDISSMFLLFKGICTHLAKLKKFNTDFYFEGDAGQGEREGGGVYM